MTRKPWTRSGVRGRTEAGTPYIGIGAQRKGSVVLVLYGRGDAENREAEADARAIVRGVNFHDELVEALVEALEHLGRFIGTEVVYRKYRALLEQIERYDYPEEG